MISKSSILLISISLLDIISLVFSEEWTVVKSCPFEVIWAIKSGSLYSLMIIVENLEEILMVDILLDYIMNLKIM